MSDDVSQSTEQSTSAILRLLAQAGGYAKLCERFEAKPHPFIPLPPAEKLSALAAARGDDAVVDLLNKRNRAITLSVSDPWNYACILAPWKRAEELLLTTNVLACLGGNRSGKTTWGIRKAIEILRTKPNANVLILHEAESTSIELHHKRMWEHFPLEWRVHRKKSRNESLRFDAKNGFSGNKFVVDGKFLENWDGIDNDSDSRVCTFGNYNQDQKIYEGLEYDFILCDENLPLLWLNNLMRCLATRNGKLVWAYTPIDGVTPAINEILAGARTLESLPIIDPDLLDPNQRHVDDCPVGHMPYVQQGAQFGAQIIYFHSHLNPFGGYEALKTLYGQKDKHERERRFFGYARKLQRVAFPQFSAVNVITTARWCELSSARQDQPAPQLTRYHIIDPAGTRNIFMLWCAVDPDRRHFIYREWPDVATMGEWAVPSKEARKWDGDPGPAQPTLGYGISAYKRLILTAEGHHWDGAQWDAGQAERIYLRYCDPRSGRQETIAEKSGGMSLMDRFAEPQFDGKRCLIGPPLDFDAAPGLHESEGMQEINTLLEWNPEEKLTAGLNEPRLYIAENCQNLIWAMRNYTGHDGEKAACKDPIDTLRYAATAALQHLNLDRPRTTPTWGY